MPIDLQHSPAQETITPAKPQSRTRLTSLDAFRGITIAAMILVNDPGDRHHTYWPLEHADWNGWTPTDLIFPFFLFIVGISMVLSFDSRKSKGATNAELLLHSLKRSAIIFALGVFLYAYPRFNVHTTRIPGVLQRIAIVYLVTSPLVLYAGRATRSIVAAAILLSYWMLMVLVPVPGYGAGVLTMDGSLATYVDRALLYNHLEIAHRFDPEGILSTLPALATCLFGVMAGQWIQRKHGSQLIRALLAGAVVGVSVGYGWSAWFPLNKKLWTSSYVCFTAGLAMATLALCYWIIDVCGWRKWAQPFVWFGVNPLAIYFLASFMWEVISYPSIRGIRLKEMVYQHFYVNLFTSPYVNSAFYAVSYVCLFVIIAWLMYRRNIFIKV